MEQKDTSPNGTPVMTPERKSEIRESVLKRIASGEDRDTVLREAAEQGDAVCQLVYGQNVRSKEWWEKALHQNLAYALMFAALWHCDDDELAEKYFAEAAMMGNLYAQFHWAEYLDPREPMIVKNKSFSKAMTVYRMAANNTAEPDEDLSFLVQLRKSGASRFPRLIDDWADTRWRILAQRLIGGMYEYGFGVKKNKRRARRWYLKAVRLGGDRSSIKCLCRVSRLKLNGKGSKSQKLDSLRFL